MLPPDLPENLVDEMLEDKVRETTSFDDYNK